MERILNEISPVSTEVSTELVEASVERNPHGRPVLVADDSSVARKQVSTCTGGYRGAVRAGQDGREALNMLLEMSKMVPIMIRLHWLFRILKCRRWMVIPSPPDPQQSQPQGFACYPAHFPQWGVQSGHGAESRSEIFNFIIAKFQPDELAKAVQNAL